MAILLSILTFIVSFAIVMLTLLGLNTIGESFAEVRRNKAIQAAARIRFSTELSEGN